MTVWFEVLTRPMSPFTADIPSALCACLKGFFPLLFCIFSRMEIKGQNRWKNAAHDPWVLKRNDRLTAPVSVNGVILYVLSAEAKCAQSTLCKRGARLRQPAHRTRPERDQTAPGSSITPLSTCAWLRRCCQVTSWLDWVPQASQAPQLIPEREHRPGRRGLRRWNWSVQFGGFGVVWYFNNHRSKTAPVQALKTDDDKMHS